MNPEVTSEKRKIFFNWSIGEKRKPWKNTDLFAAINAAYSIKMTQIVKALAQRLRNQSLSEVGSSSDGKPESHDVRQNLTVRCGCGFETGLIIVSSMI